MTSRDVLQRFNKAEVRYMAADQPDFAPVAATLHPDCQLCEPASLPYGGEWRGRDGVERWLRMFKATWSSPQMRNSQIFGDGDTLFSRSHVYATARETSKQTDWALLQQVKFQQSGIVDLRPFHWDTAAILPALL